MFECIIEDVGRDRAVSSAATLGTLASERLAGVWMALAQICVAQHQVAQGLMRDEGEPANGEGGKAGVHHPQVQALQRKLDVTTVVTFV